MGWFGYCQIANQYLMTSNLFCSCLVAIIYSLTHFQEQMQCIKQLHEFANAAWDDIKPTSCEFLYAQELEKIVHLVIKNEPGFISVKHIGQIMSLVNNAKLGTWHKRHFTSIIFYRIKEQQPSDLLAFCESWICESFCSRTLYGPDPWEFLCAAKSPLIEKCLASGPPDPMFLRSRISLCHCLSLNLASRTASKMIEVALGNDMDWRLTMDCLWSTYKVVLPSIFLDYDYAGTWIDSLRNVMTRLLRLGICVQDARDMLQFGLSKVHVETVAAAKKALDKHRASIFASSCGIPIPLSIEMAKFL